MAILKTVFPWLLVVISLTGCMTEKRCCEKFPPKVIIKDSLVYKDRIVEVVIHDTVFIEGDTVVNTDTVYIQNGLVFSKPVWAQTAYSLAFAQVVNSRLTLQLTQKDTSIARLLRENVIVQDREVYRTETVEVKVWEVHWYDKVARWVAGIFLLSIVVLIGVKLVKSYFKPF